MIHDCVCCSLQEAVLTAATFRPVDEEFACIWRVVIAAQPSSQEHKSLSQHVLFIMLLPHLKTQCIFLFFFFAWLPAQQIWTDKQFRSVAIRIFRRNAGWSVTEGELEIRPVLYVAASLYWSRLYCIHYTCTAGHWFIISTIYQQSVVTHMYCKQKDKKHESRIVICLYCLNSPKSFLHNYIQQHPLSSSLRPHRHPTAWHHQCHHDVTASWHGSNSRKKNDWQSVHPRVRRQ